MTPLHSSNRPSSPLRDATLVALFFVLAGSLLFWRLGDVPPPWWDEGWNMTVARNWMETGQYVRLLDGQPVAAQLQGTLAVTAPVALTFRLLGVGYWQARLPFAFMTLAALGLLGFLALQLYDRRVALATLCVALLMSGIPAMNPVIAGRQVLGEMPALLALLAGFACLLGVLRRAPWLVVPGSLFLGLAAYAKLQFLPFVLLSLVVATIIAYQRRCRRSALLLIITLTGTLLAERLFRLLQMTVLSGTPSPDATLTGMYEITAFVLRPANRFFAASIVLTIGLPVLCGVVAETITFAHRYTAPWQDESTELVRAALLTFCAGWLAWYVLLSVGWSRYVFAPLFIGNIFTAALLDKLTGGYRFGATLRKAAHALKAPRTGAGALLAVILLAVSIPLTLAGLLSLPLVKVESPAVEVTEYLNSQTAPEARIETYETELFILLQRRYHYPPDQLHVELIRRNGLGQDTTIAYDPLESKPDYLVVGSQALTWDLYQPVIESGAFSPVAEFGGYTVYRRHR